MTKAQLDEYRALLEAKQKELMGGLRKREGIEIEAQPDEFDEAQRTAERELLILTLDRGSIQLRAVRAALARIADDSFGICLQCDEPISPRRLAVVPWAPLCLKCQEWVDAHPEEGSDEFDRYFMPAA